MKKLILVVLGLCFFIGIGNALADCTVTVNWTPSIDTNAAIQQVWYFDGSNDVMKDSGDMTLVSSNFTIPTGDISNDTVWVRTTDSSGANYTDTVKIPVTSLQGAVNVTVTTNCQ